MKNIEKDNITTHTHVACYDDNGTLLRKCATCGEDLAHECHERIQNNPELLENN